ncbi:DNA-binding response OmpR family regulator [Streptacidiphilus sp. MAP12-33]
MTHPRLVFTRRQPLDAAWPGPDAGDGRTVDVHVARVRTKLGAPYRTALATVRGAGYRYSPDAVPSRPGGRDRP